MWKRAQVDPGRVAAALLALLCVAVAATCASTGELQPVERATAARSEADRGSARPDSPLAGEPMPAGASAAAQPRAAALSPSAGSAPGPVPALPRFCAALQALEAGSAPGPVRVLWLGDSHTYADFLTHAVRRLLQQRYGNGGPGFIHLGLGRYRHGAAISRASGPWRQEPSPASRSSPSEDGVFGLAGIRAVPERANARARVELVKNAVAGQARWRLMYRLPSARASFRVRLGSKSELVRGGEQGSATQLQTLAVETGPAAVLELDRFSAEPELFGVIVESTEPGVVVDTLGINGARAATPLAWDEASWVAQVAARAPALVVLAYGTNEVFATAAPERYQAHFEALLGRLRRAQPEFDCVFIGPTDVPGADGATQPRVFEIEAVQREAARGLGCSYFSLVTAMGGVGSFSRWAEQEPPLAAPDRVHLTQQGYERLGGLIGRQWLSACEQR
jgi:lysophospholipase L1-like esterase